MLKIFSRLFGDKPEQNTTTTEYGNQEKKENEIMAKAKENTKVTTNKATENKEETTMKTTATETKKKATTKTSAKAKGETTMKATERKTSTKATAKATTNKTAQTKESKTMKNAELVTITINGIQIQCTSEQAIAITNACAKANEVKELSTTKATATKGKTTSTKAETKATKGKSSAKKTATAKAETKTWTEKKAEYAKQFTEEERAEYGFRKSLERKATKFAYETTNAKFEERVAKKEWNKAYKEILGFLMNAIEELASESEAYTDEEVVRDFLGTVADKGIKKVRSDVKGYAKYVRA